MLQQLQAKPQTWQGLPETLAAGAQRQQAAVQPQSQGSLGSSVHIGTSNLEGFSFNIHIAQGEGCLRRETDKAKDRKSHHALSHDGVFYETLIDYGGLVSQQTDEDRLHECPS